MFKTADRSTSFGKRSSAMTVHGGHEQGLTPEERKRVTDLLAELTRRRDRMTAGLADRDPVGNEADHAEELQRDADIAKLNDRIADLTWRLEGGERQTMSTKTLPDGARFTLRLADSSLSHVRIVTIPEDVLGDESEDTVTADSPLGLALVGHAPGDTVSYQTPRGPQHAQIVSMAPPAPG
jgi:transcription elongation factor GreA